MSNFQFKGNRNYLHVTDIYNSLIKKKKLKNIKISFKKMIKNQPKIIKSNQRNYVKSANCLVEYVSDKKIQRVVLKDTKKKIVSRYSYDEKLLYPYFKIKKTTASCNLSTELTSFEVLVALNKFFNISNVNSIRWYFSRLNIVTQFDEKLLKKFSIKLKRNILNKFTTVIISQNKKKIGEMDFVAR